MFRVFAWLCLVVLVALPQRTLVKALRGHRVTSSGISQQPVDPGVPMNRSAPEPVEIDDDVDDADGDGPAADVGAVVAAGLAPGAPLEAVAMPSATLAHVLWSRAIQECGPPCA